MKRSLVKGQHQVDHFFLIIDQGTCCPRLRLFKRVKFLLSEKCGLIESLNCWIVQNLIAKELPETAAAGTWYLRFVVLLLSYCKESYVNSN